MRASINTHMLLRALLYVLPFLQIAGGAALAENGAWSQSSFSIPAQRSIRFPSPDRKKTVLIDGTAISVSEEGALLPGLEGYGVLLPAELAWAPDSKAFSMTASEAGPEGPWYVSVFILENDRVNYYDVTRSASDAFRDRYPCLASEEPDLAAIKWLKDAKRLLVVAKVPARSTCPDGKAVRGYLIEIPSGKVLHELEPAKLVEEWGEYLGPRLRTMDRR